MQLEDAKAQLATYVSGAGVPIQALKLAVTVITDRSNEPGTRALLNGLLASLHTVSGGPAPAP